MSLPGSDVQSASIVFGEDLERLGVTTASTSTANEKLTASPGAIAKPGAQLKSG